MRSRRAGRRRDLVLSPDHAVFVDGALIPVRYLLNGATIVQEPAGQGDGGGIWSLMRTTWCSAEGLPAESYLDTGNRSAFEGGAVVQAHPDFRPRGPGTSRLCRTRVLRGAARARAGGAAGPHRRTWIRDPTIDPGLRLLAAGHALDSQRYDDWMCVVVPDDARSLRVVSRTAHPAELHPHSHDWRRLGVTLVAWRMDGVDMPLDHGRVPPRMARRRDRGCAGPTGTRRSTSRPAAWSSSACQGSCAITWHHSPTRCGRKRPERSEAA